MTWWLRPQRQVRRRAVLDRCMHMVVAALAMAMVLLAPGAARAGGNARSPSDPSAALLAAQAWVEQAHAVGSYLEARQAADVVAYVQARQRADLIAYLASRTIPVDWGRWGALHDCEQPGDWYANGGNGADPAGQTFQGGLGMSTGAWQMAVGAAAARGVTLPGSALDATPEQQMTGAQAFYDAHGWAWACPG
jgi:hypothetical protein